MDNEQIIRRAYQAAEEKNIEGWVASFTEDGTFTDESISVTYRGPKELAFTVENYAAAFPDMHRELYQFYVNGDFVVVQRQTSANKGEIVVAEIPGGEATVKRYFPQGNRVVLKPENSTMEPMEFDAREVFLFGKVISVLRSY